MIFENKPVRFVPNVSAVGCFCECDGKILLLLRNKNDAFEGGKWGLPNGSIEQNETPEQAIKRELIEETGIESKNITLFKKLYLEYPYEKLKYYLFHLALDELPEIKLDSLEHTAYKWISPKEALKENILVDLDKLIKLYYEGNQIARSKEWWDKFWENQTQDFGTARKELLDFAEKFAEGKEGLTAIDVASGNGRYAIPLAKLGYNVTALELSSEGVKRIREYAKREGVVVKAEQGDLVLVCKQKREYDLVFCSGGIEELDKEDQLTTVKGLMDWTKPNGLNIIKFCLEIEGRGKLVESGNIEGMYKKANWQIIYQYEEPQIRESVANITFEKKLRTSTIVAKRI
ncbi:MAG: NUDIX domain-containing protein [archaeon]|jgi:mutator protein MutT